MTRRSIARQAGQVLITVAISAGSANRPSGLRCRIGPRSYPLSIIDCTIGVRVWPGATAFTRIRGAHSMARLRSNCWTAAFAGP
mgnify:CR=1 FL=1